MRRVPKNAGKFVGSKEVYESINHAKESQHDVDASIAILVLALLIVQVRQVVVHDTLQDFVRLAMTAAANAAGILHDVQQNSV
jgi:hypothetical protein